MSVESDTPRVPIVDYLKLEEGPHLRTNQCSSCGARFFDRRNACGACGATGFKRHGWLIGLSSKRSASSTGRRPR